MTSYFEDAPGGERTSVVDTDYIVLSDGTTDYFMYMNTLLTGWLKRSETWTQTGSHTFTVSSGTLTAAQLLVIYRKATKVKYNDGAVDFGVIGASASAGANSISVTLITNTNYSMAAVTITDTYISYSDNPEGFPAAFSYTPTWAGGSPSIGNGTLVGEWSCSGGRVFGNIRQVMGSTTNYGTGGNYSWSLPIATKTFTGGAYAGFAGVYDGSAATFYAGLANIGSGGTTLSAVIHGVSIMTSTSPITLATNDVITISYNYAL